MFLPTHGGGLSASGALVDPLSDVLRAVRLSGAFFYSVEANAPWSIEVVPAAELVPRILPGAEHLISYHILTNGRCWGGLTGEKPVEMLPGDVLVFPHGEGHRMSDGPDARAPLERYGSTPARYPSTLRLGRDGGPAASFVCGFLGCDRRPFNPLLSNLPRQILMRGLDQGWLATFAQHVVKESRVGRAGADCVLTRLAELMFIEVVRLHLESLPEGQTGWLAGLRDPTVGRALGLLHADPRRAWTLEALSREVAASRSKLTERFTAYVGQPPMRYLAQWRMQLAAGLLSRSGAKVAAVASAAGYDSEAAFSRAFKKSVGMAPGAWRRRASLSPGLGPDTGTRGGAMPAPLDPAMP